MFYGWKIVGVTWVTHFVSVGFIFYSYGVFFHALEAEFGGSRLGVSMGLALMNLATGIFAPYLGRLLDGHSIRNVMFAGTVSMAAGFFLASQMTSLWQFYVLLGTLLGLGAASVGGIPGSTLVAKWFVRQRGKALGISTMGISASGVVMAPLGAYLIERVGWRTTFFIYGVATCIVLLPLIQRYVISRPEDVGLTPDGGNGLGPGASTEENDAAEPILPLAPGDQFIDHPTHIEWSAVGVFRDRNFWVIVLVMGLNFFAMSALLTHMVPYAQDLGYTLSQGATILAASAGIGVAGKVIIGWLTDHIETRVAFWFAIAFQAGGAFMMYFVHAYWGLFIAAAIFGFGMGGVVPLWGSLVGDAFGRHSFGRIMGLTTPFMLPLQTTGVPFAGYIYDRTQGYALAFEVFVGVYIASAIILLFFKPLARER